MLTATKGLIHTYFHYLGGSSSYRVEKDAVESGCGLGLNLSSCSPGRKRHDRGNFLPFSVLEHHRSHYKQHVNRHNSARAQSSNDCCNVNKQDFTSEPNLTHPCKTAQKSGLHKVLFRHFSPSERRKSDKSTDTSSSKDFNGHNTEKSELLSKTSSPPKSSKTLLRFFIPK